MIAALARFRRRPAAQRWLLVRAAVMLGVMRVAIRLRFQTVSRVVGLHRGESPAALAPDGLARAAAIGWAVQTASWYVPWESTCLVRALAAATLLRRRGIDATLYLGVARDATTSEGMTAHAWLRCGELIVTGEAERARHTPIASFISPGREGDGGVPALGGHDRGAGGG